MLLFTGCQTAVPEQEERRTLRVMTYSSFDMDEEVIAAFSEAYNADVQFLDAGDTGQMLNQAILSKSNPQGDVMYGLDNTFLSRALEAEIFIPYKAKGLESVPEAYQLAADYAVTPVDFGDVCLNYDRAYFEENNLALPQNLMDLTQPEYKSLLVVENPASSSPGLAFLITTIGAFGDDAFIDYWEALVANDVLVVEDWDSAYWGEFSGSTSSEGQHPLVVSYATSPAAEVFFSEEALTESPTGAVVAPGTCFRQVEFAGILKNNQNQDLAEAFIDFVLDESFQSAIPLHMWVFPSSTKAELPQVFKDFAIEAQEPVSIPAEQIEKYREDWIEAWTEVIME
jgi:thiamine transport system substrate-binding protein